MHGGRWRDGRVEVGDGRPSVAALPGKAQLPFATGDDQQNVFQVHDVNMTNPPASFDRNQQRARVRRTVAVLAVVAFALYAAFILRTVMHW